MLRSITLASAIILSILAVACSENYPGEDERLSSVAATSDFETRLRFVESDTDNWILHGRTYSGARHSLAAQISTRNIDQLGLQWYFDLPRDGGQEATPLVVDGVIYISAAWSIVHALDAKTGERLWSYDPNVDRSILVKICCGPVNRGVAYWDGKIYVGALDGRLIALAADSGEELWSSQTLDDPDASYSITGAPLVAGDKVFIGNGGAEFGVRGYVTAYNADTGEKIWRFYTVPGDPDQPYENDILKMAAKTWHGEWWKVGGGGTAYDALAYDPQLNLFYVGVGNAGPYNPLVRTQGKGDNLFVSSIVALDADSGKYVWHYQTTPGDSWDYTATQNMILADLEIEGTSREVIMQAPKNGFFYVLDRATGEFISAEAFEKVTWASGVDAETGRPIVNGSAKYWLTGKSVTLFPSAMGAHNWQPMAFNPDTGLVYIPTNHMPSSFQAEQNFKMQPLGRNTGIDYTEVAVPVDPALVAKAKQTLRGNLLAWDPVRQKPAWSVELAEPGNGGALSTAGDLVFQGTALGEFAAYNATSGEKLWSFDAQTSVIAAPVSYQINGELYIAVLAGRGGALGRSAGKFSDPNLINRSRLLVFKRGGQAILPSPDEPMLTLPDLTELPINSDVAVQGGKLYANLCASCHGFGAVGGSLAPDLRYSGFIRDQVAFDQVVMEGILRSQGMVGFKQVINPDHSVALRQYLVQQNQVARKFGDTERVGR